MNDGTSAILVTLACIGISTLALLLGTGLIALLDAYVGWRHRRNRNRWLRY